MVKLTEIVSVPFEVPSPARLVARRQVTEKWYQTFDLEEMVRVLDPFQSEGESLAAKKRGKRK